MKYCSITNICFFLEQKQLWELHGDLFHHPKKTLHPSRETSPDVLSPCLCNSNDLVTSLCSRAFFPDFLHFRNNLLRFRQFSCLVTRLTSHHSALCCVLPFGEEAAISFKAAAMKGTYTQEKSNPLSLPFSSVCMTESCNNHSLSHSCMWAVVL